MTPVLTSSSTGAAAAAASFFFDFLGAAAPSAATFDFLPMLACVRARACERERRKGREGGSVGKKKRW